MLSAACVGPTRIECCEVREEERKMCGRARCTLRPDDVPRACHRHGVPARFLHTDRYRPSFNVAPGASMPVLRRDSGGDGNGDGVAVHCMKWGLVPSFTKKTEKPDFFKMFNARSESVSEKASFRRLLPKNRCLVAVEGFYEWKKDGSKKQPFYIHFKDGRPLVFAALYDSWQNSEGETLYTFTILTTSSSPALLWLHDRMPVILGDKDSVDMWLDDPSTSRLKTVLKPYESPDLVWYSVNPAIGKTSFDGPECILEIPLKAPEKNLISKFFSAKQPKREERNREDLSINENVAGDLKEEPTAETHRGSEFSVNIQKYEELGKEEKRSVPDEAMDIQRIVKVEPVGSTVKPSVKVEPDEGTTSIRRESVEMGLPITAKEEEESGKSKTSISEEHQNQMGDSMGKRSSLESLHEESTITDLPQLPKEEPVTQEHPGSENAKEEPKSEGQTVLTSPTDPEKSGSKPLDSAAKIGRKRDYEAFSAQQKPSQQHLDKGSEKPGRKKGQKKCGLKSSEEKQSTLHWFFEKR
ncbi:PREDICTED: embryonic stem cell-specific 5-hydroxymethylcytosine-binding protein isoform X2 [Tarenaya hassleriana]|uniref:embryonic stem cell-specific 5-hydroxymethylcytosine-binding protein isoform X2 n=1 Tax=Tarenaya hassleriana TaxID=28532 RepID=UPI00053C8C5F|nr:PREDICTED: embryonic stem cell-specific 5-hydroxymethylcytosine-binding protein isoform X2 [Tarenaya hassleriana]